MPLAERIVVITFDDTAASVGDHPRVAQVVPREVPHTVGEDDATTEQAALEGLMAANLPECQAAVVHVAGPHLPATCVNDLRLPFLS
ncbi:MAG: hypothetical protein Q4D33_13915 [Prevotellaceae bacterium]|nr:hypothetical protein [Prevotellaceae bacterium]